AGLRLATGQGLAAGGITAAVADLTEGVLQAMWMTRLKVVGAIVVVLALLGGGAMALLYRAYAGEPKPDPERFQGSWQGWWVEREGPQADENYLKSMKMVFAGTQVTVGSPARNQVGTFQINPAAKPKSIDIITGEQERMPGIYELEKETL